MNTKTLIPGTLALALTLLIGTGSPAAAQTGWPQAGTTPVRPLSPAEIRRQDATERDSGGTGPLIFVPSTPVYYGTSTQAGSLASGLCTVTTWNQITITRLRTVNGERQVVDQVHKIFKADETFALCG